VNSTAVQPRPGERAIAEREASLLEREAELRLMDEAFEERARVMQQVASGLADREAAVRAREDKAWLQEDTHRLVDLAMIQLQTHNGELRQANEKLVFATLTAQELREQAQVMRRRQDEFLAMLAHELRNPLAPVSAALDLIERLEGKPVPAAVLGVLRRQVQHMVRLVDDLLDVSRVTQGKVTLQRRPTAVAEFVQHAVETSRDLIIARDHRLTLDLGATPLFVDGDPVRLAQIVTNLLQNAAKFTQEGGEIALSARRQGEVVELRVRDNGSGISAEALPNVFDLFAQDAPGLDRVQGGLGIGLTVARRMAEMHEGTVEVRSAGRGLGSEFIVTLPGFDQKNEASIPRLAVTAMAAISARILLIEDNVDAAETMAELLRMSGHDVEIALDGQSGLELFQHSRPQIVLCDVGLPGMDGYEVVARMRAIEHDPKPVVIALTGYGGSRNAERALAAGFDEHLVKPVDCEALLRIIDSAIRAEEGTTGELAAAHGSWKKDDRRAPT
jgi:signal transduction histidine kinase/ActR/RegA family two-component response regulator